jgi:hypothetical protein
VRAKYLWWIQRLTLCLGMASLAASLPFSGACADSDSSTLLIEIAPRGTVVELDGPQRSITGSPNTIQRPISGWYRVEATYPGFETWKRDLYIDGSAPTAVSAQLSPKSKWKAGLRSVFFPGWGHYYSDRNTRGAVFTVLTLGMAAGYVAFSLDANDKVTEYEDLREQFDNAQSVSEQLALQDQVEAARKSAYDAESDKRTWGYITVGVYVYQILDAVIFFPSAPEVEFGGVQLGIVAPDTHTLQLGARYEF